MLALVAAFYAGPLLAPALPAIGFPRFLRPLVAGALIALLIWGTLTSVSSIVFRRTSEQGVGMVRAVYGLGGASARPPFRPSTARPRGVGRPSGGQSCGRPTNRRPGEATKKGPAWHRRHRTPTYAHRPQENSRGLKLLSAWISGGGSRLSGVVPATGQDRAGLDQPERPRAASGRPGV
jgi:hypothetical protein